MAENPKPPVAIRIVRPFESEEEFLENELETVGKASVILIGAHSRPQGVILRFEVVLANGTTLLRGEGRVLSHKENAFRGQAGLSLRFTRLDPRSKALVDRAVAMREAKASGGMIPVAAPSAPLEPEPPPPPPPSEPRVANAERNEKRRSFLPPRENALAQALSEDTPSPPPANARSQRPSERHQSRPAPPLPSSHSTPPPVPAEEPPSERIEAPAALPQIDLPAIEAFEREPSTTQRPTAPPADDVAGRSPNILFQLTPPPAPVMRAMEDEPTHVETRSDRPPLPIHTLVAPPSTMTEPPQINAPRAPARSVEKPAERDATLARLRERAGSMDEAKRTAILDARRR